MTGFLELLNNKLLFWSVVSCLVAQFLKIPFNLFIERKFRLGIMFETGGMPSSHSALITAITSGLGLDLGFDSPFFALSVCISLIVMYDASGVRRSAGLHAIEINKISKEIARTSDVNLKETLGHTKLQVFVGSLLGPMISLPGIIYVGSPANIFNLVSN